MILNRINEYLDIKEKSEIISLSLNDSNFEDIVEMIINSTNRDELISLLNEENKEKIKKLIDGNII